MLDLFTPTQVGVAIPAAPEQICHILRQLCHQLPRDQQYVLQVDLKNAFNTVRRIDIMRAVQSHCPELSAWCDFTLRSKSPLFCGSDTVSSEEGVQQGDPLGPAFFALTILTTSRELNNLQLLKWNVWYLDDGILVGPNRLCLRSFNF